ncbi:hypothetical protein BJ508DRAFT_374627 [Ascobolus immersus RN42]|uniref:Uncharacterized protein n=1 Tax=Ascobolus immersus RN42 TaxID=1160509 RepID=A0A3N4ID28_ASCIM|nr:hypothetical protein BJ508DRAFT_374627 [Ascobolus immersus RN42]
MNQMLVIAMIYFIGFAATGMARPLSTAYESPLKYPGPIDTYTFEVLFTPGSNYTETNEALYSNLSSDKWTSLQNFTAGDATEYRAHDNNTTHEGKYGTIVQTSQRQFDDQEHFWKLLEAPGVESACVVHKSRDGVELDPWMYGWFDMIQCMNGETLAQFTEQMEYSWYEAGTFGQTNRLKDDKYDLYTELAGPREGHPVDKCSDVNAIDGVALQIRELMGSDKEDEYRRRCAETWKRLCGGLPSPSTISTPWPFGTMER